MKFGLALNAQVIIICASENILRRPLPYGNVVKTVGMSGRGENDQEEEKD